MGVRNSYVATRRYLYRKFLSMKLGRVVKRAMKSRDQQIQLPTVSKRADPKIHALLDAWKLAQISDANAPGQCVCYYSLELEGYHFPGERPWAERWNMLKGVTAYQSKRILELGCNLGLLSCYLLKECGASAALAVDHDAMILEAANHVSKAFGVSPVFEQQDFDRPEDWEATLAEFQPDIVFALSVLNWVKDKKRFLTFLGKFGEIIFEGHDSFKIESQRFKDLGFDQIRLVGFSERGRPTIHCKKNSR